MTDLSEPFDLVVVGAGAAGLAAANRAVELGGRVLVLEKGQAAGGSAALSAGILWTAPNLEVLRRIQPDCDPVLGPLVVEGYEQAVQDVRDAGVKVSDEWLDHLEWGRACKIDIQDLIATWSAKINATGGGLLTGVNNVELILDDGRVAGVAFVHDGERKKALGQATVLATGGFQGDPELKQKFIGNGADDIGVRSNPQSVGDGFRLGPPQEGLPAGTCQASTATPFPARCLFRPKCSSGSPSTSPPTGSSSTASAGASPMNLWAMRFQTRPSSASRAGGAS